MNTYRPKLVEVIHLVHRHGCMSLSDLGRIVDAPPSEIRREVDAYAIEPRFNSLAPDMPVSVYIECVRDDESASDDDLVCIEGNPERDLLGIEQFGASVYAPLYRAADDLALREPDNSVLRSAAEKVLRVFLDGVRPRRTYRADLVAQAQRAVTDSLRMRITYSRAWNPGVSDRVIDPYQVVRTGRGFEIDAGPLIDGRLRTYLVSNIRAFEVLQEPFERPDNVQSLIDRERQTSAVTGYVTHSSLWAVRKWSESYSLGRTDDEGTQFVAHLLPPVAWRAALMRVDAGDGLDLDDVEHHEEAVQIARRLMRHHGLDP